MGMAAVLWLITLFVFCDATSSQGNYSAIFCEQLARLSTDKTVYTRSETLTASCSLPSGCYSHANDVFLQLGDIILPVNDIKLHNTSFTVDARYTLHKEQNKQLLSCGVTADGSLALADHSMLSPGRLISVGVEPSPVEDVNCTVFAYALMNCSYWPEVQDTGLPMTYTMYYQHHSFSDKFFDDSRYRLCETQKGNTCVFGIDNPKEGYYAIRVKAENDLGETMKTFVVNVDYFVKLDRVDSLSVDLVGSSWIHLRWRKPYAEHHEKNTTYRINLTAQYGIISNKVVNMTSRESYLIYNITELVPYIHYEVKIQAFPLNYVRRNRSLVEAGYWSDPFVVDTMTLSDVPGMAPGVTPGGFRYNYIDKKIELFWKRVPLHQQHGMPAHQRIRLYPHYNNDSVSCEGINPTELLLGPDISSKTLLLPSVENYDICLDMKNQVGYNDSLQLLPIRISKNALPMPKFYARVSLDDQVEVHILESTEAIRYTLYWCRSFTVAACQDEELHWSVVNSSQRTHTVGKDLPVRQTAVAMSAEYYLDTGDIVSSGMTFTSHVFNKYLSDIKMPIDLKLVDEKGQGGSVILKWKKPNKAKTVYVDHFTVDYCLKQACDDSDEHYQIPYDIQGELDGTEQTVVITGLLQEKTYEIRVRSDGDGKNSSYTLPIKVTVPKSGFTRTILIVISVLSIFGAILVAAGIYTIVRKCQKKITNYRAPIDIVMPQIEDMQYLEQNGNAAKADDPYSDIHDQGYTEVHETQFTHINNKDEDGMDKPLDSPDKTTNGHANPSVPSEDASLLDKSHIPNGQHKILDEPVTHDSGIS